jgi:hypothetical protein
VFGVNTIKEIRWDDDLTFTAVKWDLHEASLVSVPADPMSRIRSFGGGADRALPQIDADYGVAATRMRMLARQRMAERHTAQFGDFDE